MLAGNSHVSGTYLYMVWYVYVTYDILSNTFFYVCVCDFRYSSSDQLLNTCAVHLAYYAVHVHLASRCRCSVAAPEDRIGTLIDFAPIWTLTLYAESAAISVIVTRSSQCSPGPMTYTVEILEGTG